MRRAMFRFAAALCCGALLFAAGCASAAAGEGARLEESPALVDRVRIVAPADGATVPLLKDGHKEFLDFDRAARRKVFADDDYRRAMRKVGDAPAKVALEWRGGQGPWHVVVKREADGKVFFSGDSEKPKLDLENLEIARKYTWIVSESGKTAAKASFMTEDRAPRMIHVAGVPNMRDIGGRIGLDGRRVRQGLVYRSAGLNENANRYYTKDEILKMHEKGILVESVPELSKKDAQKIEERLKPGSKKKPDLKHLVKEWRPGKKRLGSQSKAYLVETLGIKTDIDLRTDRECYGMKGSPVGDAVKWVHVSSSAYSDMASAEGKEAFAKVFRTFLDEKNYPIVFHCIAGADRTGSLAYILNALLGVGEDELEKDWEVTAFENKNIVHSRIDALLAVFAKYPGATPMERVEAYVKELGFTDADIARFRAIMLEAPAK